MNYFPYLKNKLKHTTANKYLLLQCITFGLLTQEVSEAKRHWPDVVHSIEDDCVNLLE